MLFGMILYQLGVPIEMGCIVCHYYTVCNPFSSLLQPIAVLGLIFALAAAVWGVGGWFFFVGFWYIVYVVIVFVIEMFIPGVFVHRLIVSFLATLTQPS